MKISLRSFSTIAIVFFFFNIVNIGAQEPAAIQTLPKKNQAENLVKTIQEAHPTLQIAENLSINDLSQEHAVQTTWGQQYTGIITEISTESLTLTTPNGMNLPFKITELDKVEVTKTGLKRRWEMEDKPESPQKHYKTLKPANPESSVIRQKRVAAISAKRKRKDTFIPYRIGIVPTAFNLPKGQLLFRESAGYLREFIYSDRYFRLGAGLVEIRPQLRVHVAIPIRKYLHLGLSAEVTDGNFELEERPRFAVAPILTIGTPDYFINFAYKSEAPMFVPNTFNGDNLIHASYWSFGGGVRVNDRIKFLTESVFIEDFTERNHFRVFAGFALNFEIQTVGAGISFWDSGESFDNFSQNNDVSSILPSFQYTIRFR